MADYNKIDRYFNDVPVYEPRKKSDKEIVSRGIRFVKLGFPCLAALLLGIMIVFPNIRKNVQIAGDITLPKKNEMEKLHMEQTIFNITDSKNRINKIYADNIDEVSPGSQLIKAINPHGVISSDNGDIKIVSKIGYFSQNTHVMDLEDNVKSELEDGTVIETGEASYDFDKEYGFGKSEIFARGEWGKLQAESFGYDRGKSILYLYGKTIVDSSKGILSANRETRYYQQENKIEAYDNVMVKNKDNTIYSDRMVGYLTSDNKKELKRAEFYGNVRVRTENEVISGNLGIYEAKPGIVEVVGNSKNQVTVKQKDNTVQANHIKVYLVGNNRKEIKSVIATGNVVVTTPKGTAKGNKGVYDPNSDIVVLYDDVVIEQNGNFIRGGYAETNLKTSISRIRGQAKGERVNGVFYNKKKEAKDGSQNGK